MQLDRESLSTQVLCNGHQALVIFLCPLPTVEQNSSMAQGTEELFSLLVLPLKSSSLVDG